MADSSPYTEPHFSLSEINSPLRPKPIEQGRFYSGFFFKSLIFALFVIVLTLFPSQAPDFISQTIFTKLWELLHLLFIGIAVAYGLFSTRNVDSDLETHSIVDNTPNYISKMFPVSSIFGDGCEIPCGSDEKRRMMMYCWNSKDSEGELGVMDEQYKPQLPNSEGNLGDSVKDDGTNVVQSWNSEHHQIKPVVVVARPYYTIGECDEVVAYKPLGLPVRSLRSSAKDLNSPKYTDESDSSSGSRVLSSKSSDKSIDRKFGDLAPSNLEQKFNDAAGLASPIAWHLRSRRTEREDKHGNVNHPSHFRPLSVDETKFESLSSQLFESTTSFLSHTSLYSSLDSILSENVKLHEEEEMGQMKTHSMSSSGIVDFQEEELRQKKSSYMSSSEYMNIQDKDFGNEISSQVSSPKYGRLTREQYAAVSRPSHFRPMSVDEIQFKSLSSRSFQSTGSFSSKATSYSSLGSLSTENMTSQNEDIEEKNSSHGALSSSPSPSPTRSNAEASLQESHSISYSMSSLLQEDIRKNLKDDDMRSLNGIRGKEPSGNREPKLHSLLSDAENPAVLAKALPKGKSVRTRRASGLSLEIKRTGEICSKQTDNETVEKMRDSVEEVLVIKGKMKIGGPDHLLKGIVKQNLNPPSPMPESTASNYQKRDKEEPSKAKKSSNEDLDFELENCWMSSEEDEVVSECVNDSGLDSEVDKKASEFIAKFKAQIQLQKEASIERSRGLGTSTNYNR